MQVRKEVAGMTPNDYINKAIHAIETDQPNLAMLYMQRGITEMRRLRHDPWLDVQWGIAEFADALNKLGQAFGNMAQILFDAFQPMVDWYSYRQDDFVLVSDV